MTERLDRAVSALEFAAANAMRTSRCPAARRAVREALAELRTARLVAAETGQSTVPATVPEPPAGHPADVGALPEAACETPRGPARRARPRGYLSAHLSCPAEDDDGES